MQTTARLAMILILITWTTPLLAENECLNKTEARKKWPEAHLWWHGPDHCWDNLSGRHRTQTKSRSVSGRNKEPDRRDLPGQRAVSEVPPTIAVPVVPVEVHDIPPVEVQQKMDPLLIPALNNLIFGLAAMQQHERQMQAAKEQEDWTPFRVGTMAGFSAMIIYGIISGLRMIWG